MQELTIESYITIEQHRISGIALIPRVSRNKNFYLPEELARADGKTVPLNWEHDTTKQPIGQVTFHYDSDLQQLRYDGIIDNENAYDEIKNHTYHVSIGAEPNSVRPICGSQQCYNMPEGLNFKELSIVATPGIPESTLNLIEKLEILDSELTHENCTFCRELGASSAQRPDSDFAYVPKGGNPSDRKLPIYDAAHVRNALARFNQAQIPSAQKSAVLAKICRSAKKFNIDSELCKSKEFFDVISEFYADPQFETNGEGIQDKNHEFVGVGQNCEICGKPRTDYVHNMSPIYPDSANNVSLPKDVGYTKDDHLNPTLATESIDRFFDHLDKLNEIARIWKESKITKNTHKFMPSDMNQNVCKVCGEDSANAMHSDASIHNQEKCGKCGGVKKSESKCAKCGGHKK